MEQALSLFSGAVQNAPAVEVPAKDAPVHHLNGTKTMKLMDPISLAKLVSNVDDRLPPLLSMIIDGLPPFQIAKYVDEAEKRMHQYVERFNNVHSLDSCCIAGLSVASYLHPGIISLDRLVAMSFNYTLLFLLDDLFFDTPNEFRLDQYGVTQSACGDPQKVKEYLDHLDAVFSQQVQPSTPTPLIETLMKESGRDLLRLSNPEWFRIHTANIVEHHHSGASSYADIVEGHNTCFKDVESYAVMRAANVGGKFVQSAIEFANDSYIPSSLRTTPYFENLTKITSIQIGFANDVLSYHKESSIEQNPRNLITVLMECEGKPFAQTVHMAMDLTNTYTRAILDLEAEALNSPLQKHVHDVIDAVAGNIYFGIVDYRYRHPNSVFPEQRDMTYSWKTLPLA